MQPTYATGKQANDILASFQLYIKFYMPKHKNEFLVFQKCDSIVNEFSVLTKKYVKVPKKVVQKQKIYKHLINKRSYLFSAVNFLLQHMQKWLT